MTIDDRSTIRHGLFLFKLIESQCKQPLQALENGKRGEIKQRTYIFKIYLLCIFHIITIITIFFKDPPSPPPLTIHISVWVLIEISCCHPMHTPSFRLSTTTRCLESSLKKTRRDQLLLSVLIDEIIVVVLSAVILKDSRYSISPIKIV